MTSSPEIEALVDELRIRYGASYVPYGTSENDESGTGFRIADIAATFSILCLEDAPSGQYDIQIESYPPGDYVYTDVVTLDTLLELIEKYRKPLQQWPIDSVRNA